VTKVIETFRKGAPPAAEPPAAIECPDDPEVQRFIDSLPAVNVARHWNITVAGFTGEGDECLGQYDSTGYIHLRVKCPFVWAHELIHAADHRCGTHSISGEPEQLDDEVVATLGGAGLLVAMERKGDHAHAWQHVASECQKKGVDPVSVCVALLNRTCQAVALVLDTADVLAKAKHAARTKQPAKSVVSQPCPTPQLWPINQLIVVFAFIIAVAAIQSGLDNGRFVAPWLDSAPLYNAWLYLGVLACLLLALFVGSLSLRPGKPHRRLQAVVSVALLLLFVGGLFIPETAQPLIARQIGRHTDDDSPLDDFHRRYGKELPNHHEKADRLEAESVGDAELERELRELTRLENEWDAKYEVLYDAASPSSAKRRWIETEVLPVWSALRLRLAARLGELPQPVRLRVEGALSRENSWRFLAESLACRRD
jgi:hypothetical protein